MEMPAELAQIADLVLQILQRKTSAEEALAVLRKRCAERSSAALPKSKCLLCCILIA